VKAVPLEFLTKEEVCICKLKEEKKPVIVIFGFTIGDILKNNSRGHYEKI